MPNGIMSYMDDNQMSNVKSQMSNGQNDVGTPQQQPVQPTPATPVKPTTPVGGMKEGAPVAAPTEWVSPSVPEVTPTAEVSKFVEATPEIPSIPQAALQAGIKHAKEATPVPTVKAEPINLTTPHPVLMALKKAHGSIKDSMSWLVSLIIKEQDKISHTKVHKEKGDFFS